MCRVIYNRADLPSVSSLQTFYATLNHFLFCKLTGTEAGTLGQIEGADGTTSAAHSLDLLHDQDWAGFSAQCVPIPQPQRVN